MVDVRKIGIIFVIAILFAVFVFAIIEAFYPSPEYTDYCKNKNVMAAKLCISQITCPEVSIPQADRDACAAKNGNLEYTDYDSNNCPKNYTCNTCENEFELANKVHNKYVFYISAILALIAIFIGLLLPAGANSMNEWIGTGFILGGTFTLFFGTMTSFRFLDRYIRPLVILLELILIIFIAYKKIGSQKNRKERE